MPATPAGASLWRVFPWDSTASPGHRFSVSYVFPRQFSGRFDLGGTPSVLYLAESPVHAVAEKIQRYRGQTLESSDLREYGRPLALVEVTLAAAALSALADLSDPAQLLRLECRPDQLMSRDVTRTQAVSRRIHEQGLTGFRLWSALSGDWHTVVLFGDRAGESGLGFGEPVELTLSHPAVVEAARALAIGVGQ